jgi:hypothetical protein
MLLPSRAAEARPANSSSATLVTEPSSDNSPKAV